VSAPGAIVLTFDNLGEASELERGLGSPPAPGPLGGHPSVTVALPRLLGELDALGLRATFFIEGLNCELYPDAVREIAARGHELGVHGWRHEAWAELDPVRERELLLRAGDAFSSLGHAPPAFRPPGGEPTVATPDLLRELGYRWWSPVAGPAAGSDGGPVSIPFEWELVDAYHLMERFAELRVRRGDGREPLPPQVVAERLGEKLRRAGGTQVVILHPFLMLNPPWWEGAQRVLAVLADLARAGRASVGPGGTVAEASS
jgi:peptidoglycan/xylan/chitin deacetylase (PgdA/CDA1 family)